MLARTLVLGRAAPLKGKNSAGNFPAVAQEILHYLASHPDARDTPEGILKWWLPASPVQRGKREVEHALDLLVAEGWLTEREISEYAKVYGLNEARLEDIRAFQNRGRP